MKIACHVAAWSIRCGYRRHLEHYTHGIGGVPVCRPLKTLLCKNQKWFETSFELTWVKFRSPQAVYVQSVVARAQQRRTVTAVCSDQAETCATNSYMVQQFMVCINRCHSVQTLRSRLACGSVAGCAPEQCLNALHLNSECFGQPIRFSKPLLIHAGTQTTCSPCKRRTRPWQTQRRKRGRLLRCPSVC